MPYLPILRRQNFVTSAVAIVSKYNLDGIDIDWEYPAMMGDSNVYRPEDKENYTFLFRDLRHALDSLNQITRLKYFVTTAVGGLQAYIDHTEMGKLQQYTDFINIMSYDYADGSDTSLAIIPTCTLLQRIPVNILRTGPYRNLWLRVCRLPKL